MMQINIYSNWLCMRIDLNGLWQISPLSDLSIPQDDITFPAPLSKALPNNLTETDISSQEWHLMHDFEMTEDMLAFPAIQLIIGQITSFAEVRINGFAVFDCDMTQQHYKKNVRPHLTLGHNRVEILFLEPDADSLLDEEWQNDPDYEQTHQPVFLTDTRCGIWQAPRLIGIKHTELQEVESEQIWHHGGGCELKVTVNYQTHVAGLVSALVKFNGVSYRYPIDVRNDHICAVFQIDAPKVATFDFATITDADWLLVEIDDQIERLPIMLIPSE